ncbi:MAG: nitroreductase [Parcubacteria group bacterium Gr01-1014_33]|nr:MAG: nitroreductase [Parcubacteria group bacterium Gr01-1014_33]
MKNNYQAWNIDIQEFNRQKSDRDRLRFLIKFAILAPSSHNSQPWDFKIINNALFLLRNPARFLPVSDPLNRHVYIALGCAIENFSIAADYFGFPTDIEYFPDEFPDATAKISLVPLPRQSSLHDHLIFSIPERRSNRNPYDNELPRNGIIDHFKKYSSHDIYVDFVSDHAKKIAIAEYLIRFREKEFENKEFRKEMAAYKKTNFTASPIGMPGFTMGFGNFLSLIAPFLIKYINVIRFIRTKEISLLVDHTPVFGFIGSQGDSKKEWLSVGRILEHILLEAERDGLQTSINALPFEVVELQQIMGISHRPQIFFRLGYTKSIPFHSPRLRVEDITIPVE